MSPGTATLTWFARHELRLALRDWLALFTGGRSARERIIMLGAGVFIAGLHALAYALLAKKLSQADLAAKPALVLVGATVVLTFAMMLSQAIEQVTRAFYARADLDLILSSPAASAHLFAVRIAAIAITGAAATALMAAPFINVAAYLGGAKWLAGYGVIAGLSALATAVAVVIAIALFRAIGPKRTRLIAQIVAAVVGAALLIGLQAAAVMSYGSLSRMAILNSDAFIAALPDATSLVWIPAFAVLGDGRALVVVLLAGVLALTAVIKATAGQFAGHAVAAAGAADHIVVTTRRRRPFVTRTTASALRAKEWMLLKRDAWLVSQTLMQVLYLLPPALLLWRDMGPGTHVHVILAPVLTMAFGQLAGGLSWLAISGEDAPDLVATAPVKPSALLRAKIEAVLAVIAVTALPLLLAMAFASLHGAIVTAVGIAAASSSAVAIQLWFKSTAKRALFRRRQVASKGATFAEAFSSIFWAGAAGFAAAGSWFALLFVGFSGLSLGVAYAIRPRAG